MSAAVHPTGGTFPLGMAGPGASITVVTPSDTQNLAATGYARSLLCIQTGTIQVTDLAGQTNTITVPANFILPVAIIKVWATNTTVTNIYAIW